MLPYRISISGISELDGFAGQRVSHVISLIDPDWPKPPALDALPRHEWYEFRIHDVIHEEPDQRRPEAADVERLLGVGAALAETRVDHLLVHCHMGVSRSTAAALILKTQFHPGREADAVASLMKIRRPAWPNSRMIRMADTLLGRGGRLIEATRVVYEETARGFPDLAEYIRETPRKVEIPEGF